MTTVTQGCMICDEEPRAALQEFSAFGRLYDGVCASCWRNSVRDGIHDVEVLINLGIPQEETT